MAKRETNGKGLVPRYLTENEIAHKATRAAELNKQLRAIPKKKLTLTQERDELLEQIAEKCEMVPHGELPLSGESVSQR